MKWFTDNHIEVDPPKRTKKMTGTRFASVLGLNTWSTPFEMWCEMTKTYEEPFEDTIYTKAGKIIEPKQAEYMKKSYFMTNLITPTEVFGKNYFKKTRGDFFPEEKIFGGMWDYLLVGLDGNPNTVLEMKTTKRSEDWQNDIPEYYALQAALYAYLLDVENVIMVVSFLEDEDYEIPENFVPTVYNTTIRPFKLHERYPDFDKYIEAATAFWDNHVLTGISPVWDEKRDAEIIKALRTNNVNPESNLEELIAEAEALMAEIEPELKGIDKKKKRIDDLKNQIKTLMLEKFEENQDAVVCTGKRFEWTLKRSETTGIDKEKLESDGLLKKYQTKSAKYSLTTPNIKKEKK